MKKIMMTILLFTSFTVFGEVIATGETAERIYQRMDVESEMITLEDSTIYLKVGTGIHCESNPNEEPSRTVCYLNN